MIVGVSDVVSTTLHSPTIRCQKCAKPWALVINPKKSESALTPTSSLPYPPVAEGLVRLLLRGVLVELEPGGARGVGGLIVDGGGGDGGGEGGEGGDGVRGSDDGGGHLAVGRVRVVVVRVQGQAGGAAQSEERMWLHWSPLVRSAFCPK